VTAILVILIFLGILLLSPVGAKVVYAQNVLSLDVRFGWIRVHILPKKAKKAGQDKPKKKKTKKEKPEKQKSEKEKKPKKKKPLSFWLDVVKSAFRSLKIFLRGIVIDTLHADVTVADADASKAALNYGRLCAAAGTLDALLDHCRAVKDYDVHIGVDFFAEKLGIDAEVEVSFLLYSLFGMVFCLAFAFLKLLIINKFNEIKSRRQV